FAPDILGMTVYTSHFHWAKEWMEYLKGILPDTKFMVGGVHSTQFPEETAKYLPFVDYVVVGEAEVVLPPLLGALSRGDGPSGVKGVVYKDPEKGVVFTGMPGVVEDMDSVPFPARHLVPNHKYYNFISRRKSYTVFNSSRGCPFRCVFCEAAGQKWRARSAKNVVDEMEDCYERFNIREFDFFDSSFTINKKRVHEVCEEIISRGLHKKIIWNVRSRVDTINEDMLVALKDAGCYRIFYGVESANPEILKKLRKSADISQMEKIITLTDKIGISTFGYFLVGCPGETEEAARESLDMALRLPLDFIIFNRLTSFPGTELYNKYYLGMGMKDFWSEYLAMEKPPDYHLGRPWTELSEERLQEISMEFMMRFYFRPKQIYRAVKNVRSLEQFVRYSKAGVSMIQGYVSRRLGANG
ncbi:MAG: B12-binding domain-containing radical SAM protein, partial [Nitrospinota bacterium]|nr:B12-binding domain-containing radical SAM protein [Nitrospinota bacterium]